MIINSRKKVQEQLSSYGLVFTDSVQKVIGEFDPSDVDWNYRDIPHLNFIHTEVEGALALATDEISSTIFLQKIGPLKVVLTAVLVSDNDAKQFYFTSVGPFILLVETSWRKIDENHTEVSTHYFVGSPKFLRATHPLIHKVLARNYRILMSEDLPMREQRGNLRKRGYSFRQDLEGHSYSDSIQIARNNLKHPQFDQTQIKINHTTVGETPVEHWDESGIRSVVVRRYGSEVMISPAICPHEGASLDGANCSDNNLECPWHGRLIKPWARVILRSGDSFIEDQSEVLSAVVERNQLIIQLSAKSFS